MMACVQQGALSLPVTDAQVPQSQWLLLCFGGYQHFSLSALMMWVRTPSQLSLTGKRKERVG